MTPWLCDTCGATAPMVPAGGTALPPPGWCETRTHVADSRGVEYRLLCPACAPLLRPRVKTSTGAESAGPPVAPQSAFLNAGSDAPAPVDPDDDGEECVYDDGECVELSCPPVEDKPRAPVQLDLCDAAREEET